MSRLVPTTLALVALVLPLAAHADEPSPRSERPWLEHFGKALRLPFGRGRIGVEVQPLTPELRKFLEAPEDRGVVVARVLEESAAASAGIAVGDVIVAAGEAAVKEPWDLIHAVVEVDEDETLALTFYRRGEERRVAVAPAAPREHPNHAEFREGFRRWHGEHGEPARQRLRQRLDEIERRLEELERQVLPGADGAERAT